MAYITGDELKTRPALSVGDISPDTLDGYIAKHIARAHTDNPIDTPYSELAVARAAYADGLEDVIGQTNQLTDNTRTIETLRSQAETFFEKHAARATTSTSHPAAVISNLTDTPLWNEDPWLLSH